MDYAGFWKRAAAAIIDCIISVIGGAIIGIAFGILMVTNSNSNLETIQTWSNVIGIIIGWLYFTVMESSPLQGTLGKMTLGIKVTDLHGHRISFSRATARHFAKILSTLLFLVGYLMATFTKKKQALHDMLASCLVVNR